MRRLLLILDSRYLVARWCGVGRVRAAFYAVRGARAGMREASRVDAQGRRRLGL